MHIKIFLTFNLFLIIYTYEVSFVNLPLALKLVPWDVSSSGVRSCLKLAARRLPHQAF